MVMVNVRYMYTMPKRESPIRDLLKSLRFSKLLRICCFNNISLNLYNFLISNFCFPVQILGVFPHGHPFLSILHGPNRNG